LVIIILRDKLYIFKKAKIPYRHILVSFILWIKNKGKYSYSVERRVGVV